MFNGKRLIKFIVFLILSISVFFIGCSFSVGDTIIPVPNILYGAKDTDNTVFLWWTDLKGAGFSTISRYTIYESTSSYDDDDDYNEVASSTDNSWSGITENTYSSYLYYKIVAETSIGDESLYSSYIELDDYGEYSFDSAANERLNEAPSIPEVPIPSNMSTLSSVTALQWDDCTDPDEHDISYSVFLGIDTLPLFPVATDVTTSSWTISPTLTPSSTYKWKIIATDGITTTSGPEWSFTTGAIEEAVAETRQYNCDVPLTIIDSSTVTSEMTISNNTATISSITVAMDITHTNTADLDIYLVAPDSTEVLLSSDNGGTGDDYSYTTFSSDALVLITAYEATVPYNSVYLPEGSFTALIGDDINGTWGLKITDDTNNSIAGTLNSWSLVFNDNSPEAISDYDTLESTVIVSGGSSSISFVRLTLAITHTSDGDLDISLISPEGTEVNLSSDNGSFSSNYTFTIFDDSANTSILSGTAPFTGLFRPEEALSAFDGETANGTWTLKIYDDSSYYTGTLDFWRLNVY